MRFANPNESTASAVEPPPIIVIPFLNWANDSAIFLVPISNGGTSKTPAGPFQTTVLDFRIKAAKLFAVSGPMSTIAILSGIFSTSTVLESDASSIVGATTTSVGS